MEVDESVQRLLAGGERLDDEAGDGDGEDGEEGGPTKRPRNEEFDEEDEDGGQPLVAADDVAANLKVWARTLQRPPKGNLKTYSEGLWRPDKQLCRVIKTRGNDLRSMGFPYEGDTHLYPEETLFLVERCKLEVGNLTTPELYEAVDLYHYLTYAYFRQTSLIVFRTDPSCPVGVAFEAHAPSSQFKKTAQNDPIFYIMFGGTRAPVPTDQEMVAIFEWANGVPVKYAMVSDEGGVFAVNLAHRPLENHTHLATVAAAAAQAGGGARGVTTPVLSTVEGGEGEGQEQQRQGNGRVNDGGRCLSRKQRREEERAKHQQGQQQRQKQQEHQQEAGLEGEGEGGRVQQDEQQNRMPKEEEVEQRTDEGGQKGQVAQQTEAPAAPAEEEPAAMVINEVGGSPPLNGHAEHAFLAEEDAVAAAAGGAEEAAMDDAGGAEANGEASPTAGEEI